MVVVGLGFNGMAMVDMVGCSKLFMVVAFGLWFSAAVSVDSVGIGFSGAAPSGNPAFGVRAKGVVAVAAVGVGLSGVFTDGVFVSVFMVTVVMVSEAISGPVERGGGETDTVFLM